MEIERFLAGMQLEVRRSRADAAGNDDSLTIEGYAVVFNSLSDDLGGFREQIAPGAFGDLAGKDIRAFWNHDPGIVLGRTKAGTLEVSEDKRGVRVVIKPPVSAAAQVESLERGDVDQMSFGFRVQKDDWQRADGGKYIRTIVQASLVEVSPVAIPAYPQTSVGLRALYGAPEIPESVRRAPLEKSAQENRRAPATLRTDDRQLGRGTKMADRTEPIDLLRQAQAFADRAAQLNELANEASRSMEENERAEYDNAISEHRRLSEQAQRAEQLQRIVADAEEDREAGRKGAATNAADVTRAFREFRGRGGHQTRGESFVEDRAALKFISHGNADGILQQRASNPVDLTMGTPATAGYAVPIGHYNRIIEKRDERRLAERLGVTSIPGKGTVVNVVTEDGEANEFVETAELGPKDKDAPKLGNVEMRLKVHSKYIDLTDELLEDEDVGLLTFIEGWIGRAMARTHNKLLVAAALATTTPVGGTILPLTGVTAAPADITSLYYNLGEDYADNAKWLMRRLTHGAYASLQGDPFVFNSTPQGNGKSFWGADAEHSAYMPALAASAKAMIFGDWSYMGMREAPGFSFLRNPYIRDTENVVRLRYYFRTVYAVLQPEAILIGQKAAT